MMKFVSRPISVTILVTIFSLLNFAHGDLDTGEIIAQASNPLIIYVSPDGDDKWSGLAPQEVPNTNEGPVQSIEKALEIARFHNGYQWHNVYSTSGRRQPNSPRLRNTQNTTGIGGVPGNVIICLKGGVHHFTRPVTITLEDPAPITFMPYTGEKPFIDGARQITNFKVETVHGKKAWVAEIPDVKNHKWFFRQLFVDGVRAQRARLPQKGWYVIEDPLASYDDLAQRVPQDKFKCRQGDIDPSWKNFQDIDMLMLSYWTEDRMPLKSIDPETNIVTTQVKSSFSMIDAHPFHGSGNARYWLENVFEALTEPGQWYLDRKQGKLYYIPLPGQSIESTKVYAPKLKQFFNISGDPEQQLYIRNIKFKGITFRHAAYTWDKYRHTGNNYENSDPGIIKLLYAQNCAFEDCTFTNIGPYAIDLDKGCTRIRITGNTFTDLGAGAIKMYSVPHKLPDAGVTGVNLITDNEIVRGGRAFPGSPAIVATRIASTIIAHNHIEDFYYNGITIGGGWYYEHACRENRILNNHIHKIGQGWLSDMGGIYIHGIQPGTVIAGNVIHDVDKAVYGGQCLYLDAAASNIIVENNLCYRTNDDIVNTKGRENIIRNNIFAFGEEGLIRCATHGVGGRYTANIFHNILLSDGGAIYRGGYTMDILKRDWRADTNLIWNTKGSKLYCAKDIPVNQREKITFEQWQEQVIQDRNSIIADPKFADAENGDFTLPANSPAYDLGFLPVDFSTAGPRPRHLRNQPIADTIDVKQYKGHID